MNNISHLLNEDEKLFHIERFQVSHSDGRLFIDVLELLNDPQNKKFLAKPYLFLSYAKDQFWGQGTTLEAALNDCLSKIKEHSIDTVLPPSTTYQT